MTRLGQDAQRRLLSGLIIVICTSLTGCLTDNGLVPPSSPPPPVIGAIDAPERAFAARPERLATSARVISLPRDLEPPIASRPWRYIVLHHTASESGDVASIDEQHRAHTDAHGQPWLGIGYHFVIGNGRGMADGEVEATFRWREQLPGAHAGSSPHNDMGIGICLVGNFETEPPTRRQLEACTRLVRLLTKRYDIATDCILRHRDVKATECPGERFPWEELVSTVARTRPGDRTRVTTRSLPMSPTIFR